MASSASASPLVAYLLVLALGVVLGMAILKVPELLPTSGAEAPAPAPAPMTHAHVSRKQGLLKALEKRSTTDTRFRAVVHEGVRFTGAFGSSGWKGAAVYTDKHGNTLSLGSTVSQSAVKEVEAAAVYKSHDWLKLPQMDLSASMVPGKSGVKYSAKLSKGLRFGRFGPEPAVLAEVTNDGLSLGVTASQGLSPDLDVSMDVKIPVPAKTKKADLIVDTKTTYKAGHGKVVFTLGGKASGGLDGASYGMSYDLGM